MIASLRYLLNRKVAVRVLCDFLLIQLCMLLALTASVTVYSALGIADRAKLIAAYFPYYYGQFFLPLSPIFPLIFALSGFYTKAVAYTSRYRTIVLVRGTGLALLLFLAVNFLLFRDELIPRSVVLVFTGLLMVAVPGSRFVKHLLVRFSEQHGTEPASATFTPQRPDQRLILVVGGAGYIGSMLVRRMLERGDRVRILDNMTYGYGAIREILNHPNLELITGDCRNIQKVVEAIKNVDSIVHLAAIVGDPACDFDQKTALEVNYAATRMLIEVAKGHGIQRFVFASSCSVYGATELMMDERSDVAAVSLYGQTKIDSEEALLASCSDTFHPTILRLATVFGNSYRPRFDLVVNLLTAKAFQEGVITIFNGQQWRPFIHVRDVTSGILRVLDTPLPVVSGQVYNLGDSRLNYTLFDMAEEIRKVFPDTRLEQIENADRRNYRVSFEKIKNQLGFECAFKLMDGILELKEAFAQGQILDYKDAYYSNQKYLQRQGTPQNMSEMDARVMSAFSGQPKQALSAITGD